MLERSLLWQSLLKPPGVALRALINNVDTVKAEDGTDITNQVFYKNALYAINSKKKAST